MNKNLIFAQTTLEVVIYLFCLSVVDDLDQRQFTSFSLKELAL